MLADYHSLTSVHDGNVLRSNKKNIIVEYFSLLPDDSEIIIFEQSKIRQINNINWILSSVTPHSLMLRAHTYKDAQNKWQDVNMAKFNYPILMAADIITYDVDLVPVWKDQKQHMEFARDIAWFFNSNYSEEVFKLPEPYIREDVKLIPWLDGRKMSKSYNNFIWIFEDEKNLKKKIMSIVTDDTPLEEPKDPDKCTVFSLIKLFADESKIKEIREKYLAWGYGYGHAKLDLFWILMEYLKPFREKREKLLNNMDFIEKRLQEWNDAVNILADKKFEQIKKVVGL